MKMLSIRACALAWGFTLALLVGCGSSDDEAPGIDAGSDLSGSDVQPDARDDAALTDADIGADTTPADAADDTVADAAPEDVAAPESDTTEPAPTFAQVREEVIAPSCSFSVCHGGRSGAGGLALGRDPFAALVGVASTAVPERTLVVAGDVEASYLWEKLTSETPAAGETMPPGSPLDADRLELVRRWIEAGALNN